MEYSVYMTIAQAQDSGDMFKLPGITPWLCYDIESKVTYLAFKGEAWDILQLSPLQLESRDWIVKQEEHSNE